MIEVVRIALIVVALGFIVFAFFGVAASFCGYFSYKERAGEEEREYKEYSLTGRWPSRWGGYPNTWCTIDNCATGIILKNKNNGCQ